jgi:hypothetical protein
MRFGETNIIVVCVGLKMRINTALVIYHWSCYGNENGLCLMSQLLLYTVAAVRIRIGMRI